MQLRIVKIDYPDFSIFSVLELCYELLVLKRNLNML